MTSWLNPTSIAVGVQGSRVSIEADDDKRRADVGAIHAFLSTH